MSTDAMRAALEALLDAHARNTLFSGAGHWEQARAALAQTGSAARVEIGHDSRILHELAGSASLCWEPTPTGVFDAQKAIGFVEAALKELRESAARPTSAEPEQSLTRQMQQMCLDWGTYWRAPDAHGVNLSHEQALELLRFALGVEVEIATSAERVPLTDEQLTDIWNASLLKSQSVYAFARAIERAHGIAC